MQRLTILSFVLLLAGCYDAAPVPPPAAGTFPATTTTLAELRRLYAGQTFEITSNVVVAGRVTTHDKAGNFYRTLIFEEDGAAAELMAGIDGLHRIYPLGSRIAVNLRGLALGESRGVLQIGRYPADESAYATDYIGSRAALDQAVSVDTGRIAMQPLLGDLASLQPEMAGCLIRIDGLRFAPEQPEPNEWAGTKRFTNDEGYVIHTYTRPYANFADREIPTSEVLLVGTLQCEPAADGSYRYTLRLRDEKDCWY